ncbi:AAA family ATPase [Streptomyces ipomoeae]|uniref:AAA family ATPase n=1 Tax=Streptomyces ipomoeae TaxID=103232 RepID=UPI001147608F|nr:SMC family ATPase [Streptomyces ipomoeae]MDX2936441.1 SMC family ATPase [Streptomyces ipomoeae]TQE24790.1 SMC family ATPase [Streptomyces ipomoeae]
MYLHRLTVQAFGPFARTEDVDFDALTSAGLFLLRGDTGAGKTSILDAVCFALYGSVPGIRPTHRLRSDHAPDDTRTRVILEFTAAGRRLRITRTPKQTYPSSRAKSGTATAEATVQLHERAVTTDNSAAWEPVCARNDEAAREIEAALGLSKEQFCQVVLLPQGDFAKFLRADAKDRALLLRRLFDTGRFQELQNWLTARSKTTKKDLDDVVAAVQQLSERIDQEAGTALQDADTASERPARPDAEHPTDTGPWAQDLLARAQAAHTAALTDEESSDKAHQKAKQDHQRAVDLDTHQRQHRQALAKRAALDHKAADHPRLRELLEKGQRAEPLRPLLDGLERSALALQKAHTAEDTARKLLPAAHTHAKIPQLQLALEQHHAERGRLQGLLPDEERHTQLSAQLSELSTKEEQAQAEHDEAAQWLEAWPALQAEHTGRVEAMTKAADRIPQLERDIQSLDIQLTAARTRDSLAARLATAQETETQREAEALHAKKDWLDLRERRLDGMAGELAAELTNGEACSVCGSTVHPAPAQLRPDQPTREDEEKARTVHEQAEATHSQASRARSELAEQHAQALGTAGPTPPDQLELQLQDTRTTLQTASDQAGQLPSAHDELARLRHECDTRTQQRQKAKDLLTECQTRHKSLAQQQHTIALALDAARGSAATLDERMTELTQAAEHLAAAVDAAQTTAIAADRHRDARTTADNAAQDAGFPTREEAAAAMQPAALLHQWREELQQWDKDNAIITDTLNSPDLIEASAQPPADPQAASDALTQAETRMKNTAAASRQARDRVTALTTLVAGLETRLTELAPLQARHALADRLAGVVSATIAANTLSMELEAYVLAARLEEIADAANIRLQAMTSDRYLLVHSDEKDAGRRGRLKAGLGLRILDTWTGTERETSTLSGGETFTASLALALGLADVVTQEASGRPLGTLFIDEGFGSLDEQNLQEVMDVLDQLRAGNRAVGIVSHVAELGRRIPSQLSVMKHRNGSTLRPLVSADL